LAHTKFWRGTPYGLGPAKALIWPCRFDLSVTDVNIINMITLLFSNTKPDPTFFGSGTDSVSLHISLLIVVVGVMLFKKPEAPSFQIGSG